MTGDELKRQRARAGLTQQALADRLGVARVTVARWEIGVRGISHVAELAIRYVLERERKRRRKKGGK